MVEQIRCSYRRFTDGNPIEISEIITPTNAKKPSKLILRIPLKPAGHSDRKAATDSDTTKRLVNVGCCGWRIVMTD
jgi:hypothetical protein